MKDFFRKHHRLLFYGSWLLLGFIQAYCTQLDDDEAYYWVYSKFLAWGYFDHPPMIALMIKAGYFFFKNELGVRLFSVLLSAGSIYVIEKIIRPKVVLLFYAVVLSVGVFQISGIMAAPDIPLIFFTAVFFYCYKKFISQQSLYTSLLLGIACALMLYSKYHGVLVMFFTFLSNLKLLRRYHIYLAGSIALLCFLPHLWWQYQHNWPSIQYHLFERNADNYKFSFTIEYLFGQILLAGPIAGFILLPACLKYKPMNETEKALRFSMFGVYIFFLLSTLKGRVEANWTAVVIIPLIVLSYLFLVERPKWSFVLLKTLPFTLLLVLFARVALVIDILPVPELQKRFHGWKDWPQKMKEKTNGLPVVFYGSYQRASKYWFYTGQMSYSLNGYLGRRNNYDYWPIEDSLLGKPVFVMDTHRLDEFPDSIKTPIGWIGYRLDPFFYSFTKIKIIVSPKKILAKENKEFSLHCRFEIPDDYSRFIRSQAGLNANIRIAVFNKAGWLKDIFISFSIKDMIEKKEMDIKVNPGLSKGNYSILFSIQAKNDLPTHNSERISLVTE